jgi:hypothetical protein
MVRRLGRMLAIVAVMAAAVDAQCVLSCSLVAMARPVSNETISAHVSNSRHACCPNPKSPGHGRQDQNKQPCPSPVSELNAFPVATQLQQWDVPRVCDPAAGYSFDAILQAQRSALPASIDLFALPDLPAFFVLRL